jgi:hypothetical protein
MMKSVLAGLVLSAVLASGAHAQYPGGPMDQFSATAIPGQLWRWQYGLETSTAAGWAYFNAAQQSRALGLPVPDGPPLGYQPRQMCGPVFDPVYGRYNILCR